MAYIPSLYGKEEDDAYFREWRESEQYKKLEKQWAMEARLDVATSNSMPPKLEAPSYEI